MHCIFIDAVEDSTVNDMLLAQMLQLEFDKENDAYIKAQEHHTNGSNKGKYFCQSFEFVNLIIF